MTESLKQYKIVLVIESEFTPRKNVPFDSGGLTVSNPAGKKAVQSPELRAIGVVKGIGTSYIVHVHMNGITGFFVCFGKESVEKLCFADK